MDGSTLPRSGDIERLYPDLEDAARKLEALWHLSRIASRPALRPGSAEHRIVQRVAEYCADILERSET